MYPPVNSAVEQTQSEKANGNTAAAPPVKKQSSLKDMAGITQGARKISLDAAAPVETSAAHGPPARNNIAARTAGHAGVAVSINTPGTSLGMVVSPPSTPPASSSGRRGGRSISYTVSADQSMATKPQASPPTPNEPNADAAEMPTVQMSEVDSGVPVEETHRSAHAHVNELPALRRTGSNVQSRPTSPSPLVTQKSAHKIELHPHVVNIEVPLEVQQTDAPIETTTPPEKDQERLKFIPPDLVEGKTVIPHVGLYPMVRMPTERMKNDLGLGVSPPGSRDGKRRGSRSVAPNLSTVSDAMEISPDSPPKDAQLDYRRMSAGTIMAHNIILNAAGQDPSPKSTAGVPVTTPPYEGGSQEADDHLKSDPMPISRMRSNTSDGHTSNSTRSVDASEEGSHDFGETSAFIKNGSKKSISVEQADAVAEDDCAMDIDTESSVRPAVATTTPKAAPLVLSSGASTFTMGFHKKM